MNKDKSGGQLLANIINANALLCEFQGAGCFRLALCDPRNGKQNSTNESNFPKMCAFCTSGSFL